MHQNSIRQRHSCAGRPPPGARPRAHRPDDRASRGWPRPLALALGSRALLALTMCWFFGSVLAVGGPGEAAPAPSPDTLRTFFDARVPGLLADHGVPGASVAVVSYDGSRFISGYGIADRSTGREVTPGTPFELGSTTKLLTWTAVMQLVERGKLDLDQDVSRYLAEPLPEAFDAPVTLRHLMTHTAGFEDRPFVGLLRRDAAELPELETVLRIHRPDRVNPPGRYASYSNYGSALAGHIVARVAGMPWEHVVEREIFAPLGMTSSTVRQPPPAAIADSSARGYESTPRGPRAAGPAYATLAPAGAWRGSAEDAARFMLAHLGDGSLASEATRILDPVTVHAMREPLHRHDPRVPGNAHGWWENDLFGERILEHGGAKPTFHTQLAILPERGVGFFVATNGANGKQVREALWHDFLATFYALEGTADPRADDHPSVEANARVDADLQPYAGVYQGTRYGTSTLARLAALFNRLVVAVDGDALEVGGNRYAPQGEGVFLDSSTGARLVFRGDGARPRELFVSSIPRQAYVPLPWHGRLEVHGAAIAGTLLVLTSLLVAWPFATRRAQRRGETPSIPVRTVAAAAAVMHLAFVIMFAWLLADPSELAFGANPILLATLTVGVLAAAASVAYAGVLVLAWRRSRLSLAERVQLSIGVVACGVLVGVMEYWNLLGYRL